MPNLLSRNPFGPGKDRVRPKNRRACREGRRSTSRGHVFRTTFDLTPEKEITPRFASAASPVHNTRRLLGGTPCCFEAFRTSCRRVRSLSFLSAHLPRRPRAYEADDRLEQYGDQRLDRVDGSPIVLTWSIASDGTLMPGKPVWWGAVWSASSTACLCGPGKPLYPATLVHAFSGVVRSAQRAVGRDLRLRAERRRRELHELQRRSRPFGRPRRHTHRRADLRPRFATRWPRITILTSAR